MESLKDLCVETIKINFIQFNNVMIPNDLIVYILERVIKFKPQLCIDNKYKYKSYFLPNWDDDQITIMRFEIIEFKITFI
jgi:hypothetical protein